MTSAEKGFSEFDWNDARWSSHVANLFPTPSDQQMQKYKRNWYRRTMDASLPTEGEKQGGSTTSGGDDAKEDRKPEEPQKKADPTPPTVKAKQRYPTISVVKLIGTGAGAVGLVSTVASLVGSTYRIRNIAIAMFAAFCGCNIMFHEGLTSMTSMLNREFGQQLMYLVGVYSGLKYSFPYMIPPAITAAVNIAETVIAYPTTFSTITQYGIIMKVLRDVSSYGAPLRVARASLHGSLLILLIPLVIMRSIPILSAVLYCLWVVKIYPFNSDIRKVFQDYNRTIVQYAPSAVLPYYARVVSVLNGWTSKV